MLWQQSPTDVHCPRRFSGLEDLTLFCFYKCRFSSHPSVDGGEAPRLWADPQPAANLPRKCGESGLRLTACMNRWQSADAVSSRG